MKSPVTKGAAGSDDFVPCWTLRLRSLPLCSWPGEVFRDYPGCPELVVKSKWRVQNGIAATLCEAAPLFPRPFCALVGTFRYDKDVRYHANGFRTAPGFVSQGLKTVVNFTWFLPEPNEPRR